MSGDLEAIRELYVYEPPKGMPQGAVVALDRVTLELSEARAELAQLKDANKQNRAISYTDLARKNASLQRELNATREQLATTQDRLERFDAVAE